MEGRGVIAGIALFLRILLLELYVPLMIFQDKASALNIIGIYSTNAFKMGVGIQTARFNHSCCSNAEAIWDDEDKTRNTRAVSKITAGEEININYHWEGLSMKNLKTRQSLLLGKWGFKCCCDICKSEEITPDDEKYELFEKLKREIKNCMQNQTRQDRMARLENIKKELVCHKEMYKLAAWLFSKISLGDGFLHMKCISGDFRCSSKDCDSQCEA